MPRDTVITLDVGTTLEFRTAEVSEIAAAVIRANIIEAYAETVEEVDWRALLRSRAPVEPVSTLQAERMRLLFGDALTRGLVPGDASLERGPSGFSELELDILALCVGGLLDTQERSGTRQCRVQRYIVDRVRDCILERPDNPAFRRRVVRAAAHQPPHAEPDVPARLGHQSGHLCPQRPAQPRASRAAARTAW